MIQGISDTLNKNKARFGFGHFLRKERLSFLILLLIFLFQLINNINVIRLDNTPLLYDARVYYVDAKILFNDLKMNNFFPPMASFLILPLFGIFGISQRVAVLGIGSFSLFVLLVTTYLLAKELYSKEAGLLSAFILSNCPIIFGHSRSCMSDLLCAGWITFTILLMAQARAFVPLREVIMLGIVMGLGMLTRVAYPLYIIGPLIYLLLKKKSCFNKRIFFNLVLIALLAFSIFSIWYVPYGYRTFRNYVNMGQFSLIEADSLSRIFEEFFYYIFSMLGDGMSIIALPLFLVILLKRNKNGSQWLPLLLIWIVIPYFILSIFDFKNMRFVIPLLPAIVIGYSFLVLNIKKNIYKKIAVSIILFLGVTQTLLISYSFFAKKIYPLARSFDEWNYQQFGLLKPWRQDWKFVEICNSIKKVYPDIKKNIVFINARCIISDGLKEMAEEGNFEISLTQSDLCDMGRDRYSGREILFSLLNKAHIVISVENGDTDECPNEDRLRELFTQHIDMFEVINMVPLPDGSHLKIYKRLMLHLK